MTAIKTATQNIESWRGGTKPHYMHLTDKKNGNDSDVSGWTDLKMFVFAKQDTTDDSEAVAVLTGQLTTDGLDGRLQFAREQIPPGRYYHRCRATDSSDSCVFIFCAGKYWVDG